MNNITEHILKFSINHWQHLYSIKEAISITHHGNGKTLSISGKLINSPLFDNQTTGIIIYFKEIEEIADYPCTQSGDLIFGQLTKNNHELSTTININEAIFTELKKNIIEYTDIEGIHIVVSLIIKTPTETWTDTGSADIISLEYAMKGDS